MKLRLEKVVFDGNMNEIFRKPEDLKCRVHMTQILENPKEKRLDC